MGDMLNICTKIVVPFDNSEISKKALEVAITLAKHEDRIELDVISVADTHDSIYHYGIGDPVRKAKVAETREILNQIEKKLNELPNKTKTYLIEGNPAVSIIDFIKNENVDLVVMGSRGLSGLKEMFLGSVSHYVVQKSSCPVFIVK
jgi:nucleotide-binding universal stress UspA family protein